MFNWPLGAALSFMMLAIVLLMLAIAAPSGAAPARAHDAKALSAYLGLVLVFLYLPIAVMMAMAFNARRSTSCRSSSTSSGLRQLADNAAARGGLEQHLDRVLQYGDRDRARHHGGASPSPATSSAASILQVLLFPPITIPWLIIGTAMLIFFFWTGIGRGLHAILLGHVALSLPYVIVVVGAGCRPSGRPWKRRPRPWARRRWQTFRRVTLPMLAPGVVAAALFAFAVSFDQFVISYFLAPPGTSTLPVEIYTAIRKGFTPEINAISTIIIVVSMGLMLRSPRASIVSGGGTDEPGRGRSRHQALWPASRARRVSP